MKIIKQIDKIRAFSVEKKMQGKIIGFVPTMGFLHEGHLSLIDKAKKESDIVIVSIFVNPTQFAPNEDLEKYPRDFESDRKACKLRGVDAIFYPDAKEYYYPDASTWVIENELSKGLCGASRPEHFRGVGTVVIKLFNSVLPDIAIFGEKDYQQVAVIKRIARDLNFPVKILTGPIIRESDGLAMSSRNKYLSKTERENALSINKSLFSIKKALIEKKITIKDALKIIEDNITDSGGCIDYIKIVDADTLIEQNTFKNTIVIAVAVFFGKTRLIDNIIIERI
jgi:pantoate--beta-alanine ligase